MTIAGKHSRWILAGLCGWLGLVQAHAGAAQTSTPGSVLRQYLDARLRGDVTAASGLWSARELHRARAMGTQYDRVEARFDDYWLLAADDRQRAADDVRLVLADSVVGPDAAHFTVGVVGKQGGAPRTQLRYVVLLEDGAWRIALPVDHDSRNWTRRDGRYLHLRSKRLARVNRQALSWLDQAIPAALQALGGGERALVRLERVKLEFYVCETDEDLRELLGATDRAGYLAGTERVVSRAFPDLASAIPLLLNLSVRDAGPALPAWLRTGLAAALGGSPQLDAHVLQQRLAAAVRKSPAVLDQLDSHLDTKEGALPVAALWCGGLLNAFGPETLHKVCRQVAGTPRQANAVSADMILRAYEQATGKSRDKLRESVVDYAKKFAPTIRAGATTWPENVVGLSPLMQWRDLETVWGLNAWETGDDYTVTLSPVRNGLPFWAQQVADSLAKASGGKAPKLDIPPPAERPAGDPPEVAVVLSVRHDPDPEAFDSPLYSAQFSQKEYAGEVLAMFVRVDLVRVYDYRRGVIVAEHDESAAPSTALPYWQDGPGRLAFRMPRSLFDQPLVYYGVRANRYTGD